MARTSTFRRLWQPPGRYAERPSERRVTFLELFFDLVFVVVISQLAHRLAEHPSWSGVGWFVFLFYAVWSSWLNGTLVIAMAAGGAGVLNTVEHAAEPLPDSVRWLLVASLATAVLSVALLTKTLEERRAHRELYRAAIGVMLGSVLLSLVVGLTNWGAKGSLTAMVILLLAPVAAGLGAWLRNTDPDTVEFT